MTEDRTQNLGSSAGDDSRFTTHESQAVVLPIDDVDTDQIIPASFLKTTTRSGLGEGLFASWRRDPDFVLARPSSRHATILVAGQNFGCGSSREHAVWALRDYGFRVIISPSFADIFAANAAKNALVTVQLDSDTYADLLAALGAQSDATLTVDLMAQTLTFPGTSASRDDAAPSGNAAATQQRVVPFPYDAFARTCMLEGLDPLGYLRSHEESIAAWEARQPERIDTRSIEGASS